MNKRWRQQIQIFGILAGACTAAFPPRQQTERRPPQSQTEVIRSPISSVKARRRRRRACSRCSTSRRRIISINYWRQRSQDLENTVRHLTGQIEQLDHRIDESEHPHGADAEGFRLPALQSGRDLTWRLGRSTGTLHGHRAAGIVRAAAFDTGQHGQQSAAERDGRANAACSATGPAWHLAGEWRTFGPSRCHAAAKHQPRPFRRGHDAAWQNPI